jgi:hypothetical protein
MKKIIVLIIAVVMFTACDNVKKENKDKSKDLAVNYLSFGEKISSDNSMSREAMYKKFKSLKKGDTIAVKFSSKINKVCKKKGCWMRLDLGQGEESMVRFKDYGFFMPLNSDNKEVIVRGKAFVTEITVDERRHYAKDEGLSEEEINKITEPEYTFAIESDGVLMVE